MNWMYTDKSRYIYDILYMQYTYHNITLPVRRSYCQMMINRLHMVEHAKASTIQSSAHP